MLRATTSVALLALLAASCTMATRHPDDLDAEPDILDEDVVRPDDPGYDLCSLEGVEDLPPEAYVIQIRNLECDTGVCLHFNLETFCTRRCSSNQDCRDIGRGTCEVDITAGDPEIIGRYCVPRDL